MYDYSKLEAESLKFGSMQAFFGRYILNVTKPKA